MTEYPTITDKTGQTYLPLTVTTEVLLQPVGPEAVNGQLPSSGLEGWTEEELIRAGEIEDQVMGAPRPFLP